MQFNIFSKLEEEISDFDNGGIWLVGKPKNEVEYRGSNKRGEKGGYYYSQRDTLESIDLASASKFKKGIWDTEKQRKTFINIVNFYRDVMKMKINIDVKDYIFEPKDLDFTWPVYFMDRQFKQWAEDESYDDQLDEFAHDLSTYGTIVSKKMKDCSERVPLRTIRCSQSAKTLLTAAENGGYVLIENEYHYNMMKGYPDWDLSGLSKSKKYCCYERYGLVPAGMLDNDEWKKGGVYQAADDEDYVLAIAILLPTEKSATDKSGRVLFMEKLDEKSWPLEECHAEKIDGRWMGRGEIEKQLENQIARNLTANLRRRGLLWATKKIYQSSDDEVQSNLVMEVRDGEVVHVKQNGTISQINTQSQHLNDFQQDENAWKENSQQISFAFNVATGENMPSGTPFRLGIVLAEQVADHFKLVRSTFSNFLRRSFFDQLIPIFQAEYSGEHTIQIPVGESSIENLRESMLVCHSNLRMFDALIKGNNYDPAKTRAELEAELARNPYIFIKIPDAFYEKASYYMRLNLTEDIGPDVTTLTSLYQAMSAQGDPRAEAVLKQILAKQGKSFDAIAGMPPPRPPVAAAPVAPGGGNGGVPPSTGERLALPPTPGLGPTGQ